MKLKLLRLKLENFRQHKDSIVEFRNGMTAIVGANGSGKSTLLEAITFALYGEQRNTRETLRFFWAEGRGTNYKTTLTFEFDKRQFVVERSHNHASLTEVSQAESPKTWAAGAKATTIACERLLSLNYEQFTNSFCAEQKGLAFLQFKNNAQRQEEVSRMLGFERLKDAEELAGARRKELATRRAALEQVLGDPVALQAAKHEAVVNLASARTKIAEAEASLKKIAEELPTAVDLAQRAELWMKLGQQMGEIGAKADGLKQNVKSTLEAKEAAEKDATKFGELAPAATEWKEIESRLTKLQLAYESELVRQQLVKERAEKVAEVEKLRQQINDLKIPAMEEIEKALAEAQRRQQADHISATAAAECWQKDKADAQALLSSALTSRTHARAATEHAEEMASKGMCPECGQPITAGYEAIVDSRRKTLEEAESAFRTHEAKVQLLAVKPDELAKAEVSLAESGKAVEAALRAKLEASQLAAHGDALQKQAQGTQARVSAIESHLGQGTSDYDAEEKKRLDQRKTQLEPLYQQYLSLRECQTKLAAATTRYEIAQKELDEQRELFAQLREERRLTQIESLEMAKSATDTLAASKQTALLAERDKTNALDLERVAKRELERAEERLKEYEARQRDLAQLKKEEVLHDLACREMRSLRISLNNDIGPDLAARASENLALLTNERYSNLELDKNFNASIVDEDSVRKHVISGGEEDVVALALRLALSELIQERQGRPMSLLILDEVFGSLDSDRRQAVLERLAALKGRFEQILVISHIEEINQVADQCLYVSRDSATKAAQVSDAPPAGFDVML
jgi:DNA repair protein SbcC/Rad50